MGLTSKRTRAAKLANNVRHQHSDSDDENTPPGDPKPIPDAPPPLGRKSKTLRSQIIEKDSRITELEAIISGLETELSHVRSDLNHVRADHEILRQQCSSIKVECRSLKSLKRKAELDAKEDLEKKHKRIRRLEHARDVKTQQTTAILSDLGATVNDQTEEITKLLADLSSARALAQTRDYHSSRLQSQLRDKQDTLAAVRKELSNTITREKRAKEQLKEVRTAYDTLRTWNPKDGNTYTADARRLARKLLSCGCAEGKVRLAVQTCAEVFGIAIIGTFMTRRTVARVRDEGGKYGEIQLAREIMDGQGSFHLHFKAWLIVLFFSQDS
jgi:DNA repair exonuclease SbcCD ATPase subunit